MPLRIVKGPPNSGRTELIRRRYLELLPARPVLVVPGVDDIFGWERRLTEDTEGLLGGQIVHFKDLCDEILELDRGPGERPQAASGLQRLHLIRAAIGAEWRDVAARLPFQPGLAESVLRLIDDFRAENVDPETLAHRIQEADLHYLTRLTAVYRHYVESLAARGLTDGPEETTRAVERVGRVWRGRPVMIAGFDELTRQQLEMVRRLAFEAGVEVTVAVTHEPDNPALALTDQLVADLRDLAPDGEVQETTTRREHQMRPHDPLLLEVEKRFMRPPRATDEPLEAGEALTVMRSAGRRNEAEAIAIEVARLVAADVPPEEIAIAVESPAQNGGMIRDTLERFGIPTTLEAETPVGSTVTGKALLDLLAAAGPNDSAAGLLAFLRSPAGPDAGLVDQLEREMRIKSIESARAAIELLPRGGERPDSGSPTGDRGPENDSWPPEWRELTSAIDARKSVAEPVARIATRIGLAVLAADEAPLPASATMIEAQAGAAISRACREIGEMLEPEEAFDGILDALRSGLVSIWAVPASGTVRIASPYSMRAKRLGYLFCASLQESGLTDTDRAGPFLSAKDRQALLMTPHRDPEVQQRYLFYSSLAVPTKRLWLSCRTSDETGKVEHPSPLIGSVEELFLRDEHGRPILNRGGRAGSEITFQPADAPTERELGRSLAASTGNAGPATAELGVSPDLAETLAGRLEQAASVEAETRKLRSLTHLSVLEALGRDATLGATEIERYAGCPYRWFIESQLDPQPFGPDPEPLAAGTLIHAALEEIYGSHPGEVPRPETIESWVGAVSGIVDRNARSPRVALGDDSVGHRVLRSRITALISAHLRREAAWDDPRHLPHRLEAAFGTGAEDAAEAIPMNGWSLKGKIDRIDLSPKTETSIPREAVIVDYKSGAVDHLTHRKAAKERKLQVQLYLYAVGKLLDAEPVGGIYVSLGQGVSRGVFAAEAVEEMTGRGMKKVDGVDDLEGFVTDGVRMADQAATGLLCGVLDHDPATCPHHFDHPAVPDRPAGDAERSIAS